eukprot:SAG11_NODE_3331_length_2520_cov_3.661710_2_plen_54_part_00
MVFMILNLNTKFSTYRGTRRLVACKIGLFFKILSIDCVEYGCTKFSTESYSIN